VFRGMLRGIAKAALREMRDLDEAKMPHDRFSGGGTGSSAEAGMWPPNGKSMARPPLS